MSEAADTAHEISVVLDSISNLRGGQMLGVGVISTLVILAACLFIWLRHRERTQEARNEAAREKRKDERQGTYIEQLRTIAKGVAEFSAKQDSGHERLHQMFEKFNENSHGLSQMMGRVELAIGSLMSRTNGDLSRDQVLSMVEGLYNLALREQVIGIFTSSLIENDYLNRKEFIARKIRTEIGEAISSVRSFVSDIPSRVSIDVLFHTTHTADRAERFALCDELWLACESLYRDNSEITHKLDQLRVLVSNVVKDHFDAIRAELSASQTGAHQAVAPIRFHNPLPGAAQ